MSNAKECFNNVIRQNEITVFVESKLIFKL